MNGGVPRRSGNDIVHGNARSRRRTRDCNNRYLDTVNMIREKRSPEKRVDKYVTVVEVSDLESNNANCLEAAGGLLLGRSTASLARVWALGWRAPLTGTRARITLTWALGVALRRRTTISGSRTWSTIRVSLWRRTSSAHWHPLRRHTLRHTLRHPLRHSLWHSLWHSLMHPLGHSLRHPLWRGPSTSCRNRR